MKSFAAVLTIGSLTVTPCVADTPPVNQHFWGGLQTVGFSPAIGSGTYAGSFDFGCQNSPSAITLNGTVDFLNVGSGFYLKLSGALGQVYQNGRQTSFGGINKTLLIFYGNAFQSVYAINGFSGQAIGYSGAPIAANYNAATGIVNLTFNIPFTGTGGQACVEAFQGFLIAVPN